jgi:hypothetical protein
VFTARYALSPYIKQIRFIFKELIFLGLSLQLTTTTTTTIIIIIIIIAATLITAHSVYIPRLSDCSCVLWHTVRRFYFQNERWKAAGVNVSYKVTEGYTKIAFKSVCLRPNCSDYGIAALYMSSEAQQKQINAQKLKVSITGGALRPESRSLPGNTKAPRAQRNPPNKTQQHC